MLYYIYDPIGKLHSFCHAKHGVLFGDDTCHANIVTSNDDTFLTNVGAHFSVDQSGWVQHKGCEHSVCADNPSPTLRSSYSPGSWQCLIMNMKMNNMVILSWCCKMSFAWTWTVPGGCCLLVSPVVVEWWHPNRLSWCCKMSFAWTWTVPDGCCLLVSPVVVEWWHPNRLSWCCKMLFAWTWTVPDGCCLLVSPVESSDCWMVTSKPLVVVL